LLGGEKKTIWEGKKPVGSGGGYSCSAEQGGKKGQSGILPKKKSAEVRQGGKLMGKKKKKLPNGKKVVPLGCFQRLWGEENGKNCRQRGKETSLGGAEGQKKKKKDRTRGSKIRRRVQRTKRFLGLQEGSSQVLIERRPQGGGSRNGENALKVKQKKGGKGMRNRNSQTAGNRGGGVNEKKENHGKTRQKSCKGKNNNREKVAKN